MLSLDETTVSYISDCSPIPHHAHHHHYTLLSPWPGSSLLHHIQWYVSGKHRPLWNCIFTSSHFNDEFTWRAARTHIVNMQFIASSAQWFRSNLWNPSILQIIHTLTSTYFIYNIYLTTFYNSLTLAIICFPQKTKVSSIWWTKRSNLTYCMNIQENSETQACASISLKCVNNLSGTIHRCQRDFLKPPPPPPFS